MVRRAEVLSLGSWIVSVVFAVPDAVAIVPARLDFQRRSVNCSGLLGETGWRVYSLIRYLSINQNRLNLIFNWLPEVGSEVVDGGVVSFTIGDSKSVIPFHFI